MKLMRVKDVRGEDIYINPKQIESVKRDPDCYNEDISMTLITFTSGYSMTIRESVYDFLQDLNRLPVDKATLY